MRIRGLLWSTAAVGWSAFVRRKDQQIRQAANPMILEERLPIRYAIATWAAMVAFALAAGMVFAVVLAWRNKRADARIR
jgi:hypothetical protein